MKQFSNYEEAKKNAQYQGSAQLEAGAYVMDIKNVQYVDGKNGNSDIINILFDVAEGEHKDFFKNQYDNNTSEDKKWKGRTSIFVPKDDGSEKDQWTKNAFAKVINSLEASNPGYAWDWDENKWKGKKIGLVYGPTGNVIDGKEVLYNEAHGFCTVEEVKTDKFYKKLLNLKTKNGYTGTANNDSVKADANGFMDVSDNEPSEIPFD